MLSAIDFLMKMGDCLKGRIISLTAAALVCAVTWLYGTPLREIRQADYLRPDYREFSSFVTASGTLSYLESREIYTDTPVISSQVLVSPGDYVEEGAILAFIQEDLTQKVLASAAGTLPVIDQAESFGLNQLPEQYQGLGLGLAGQFAQAAIPAATYEEKRTFGQLTAPVSGVVTELNLYANRLSQGGQAAVVIADPESMSLTVYIPEDQIAKVQLGQPALLRCPALENREYSGTVARIAPVAKQQVEKTGVKTVVEVTLLVNETDRDLKPGFHMEAQILAEQPKQALTLPLEAVKQQGLEEYVWVYQDRQAKKVLVETGAETGWLVEITAGIGPEDFILLGDRLDESNLILLGRECHELYALS